MDHGTRKKRMNTMTEGGELIEDKRKDIFDHDNRPRIFPIRGREARGRA